MDLVTVRPPPPTPPPVTPPPTPPPQSEVKQQMLDQSPMTEAEAKPVDHPEPASSALGTNIQGTGGPDAFGLGKSGNGFIGGGPGGGGGSRFGWYATLVSRTVTDALGRNPITRVASFSGIKVSLWIDAFGKVIRAKLSGTSGELSVDAALRGQVFVGLRLPEPPPDGMAMPFVMRISERRPD
jgi:periplasmic protein TonB